jgi:hypothetical protein
MSHGRPRGRACRGLNGLSIKPDLSFEAILKRCNLTTDPALVLLGKRQRC